MAGFLGVIVLLGVISSLSYVQIQRIDTSYSDLIDRRAAILVQSKDIQNYASRENSSLRAVLLQEEGAADTLATLISDLDAAIADSDGLARRAETREALAKLAALNAKFKGESDKVIELLRTDREAAVTYFVDNASPVAREIRDVADQITQDQARLMEEGTKANTRLVSSVNATVVILSLIALALAIGVALLISRIIASPILALAAGAEVIASGDLTQADIRVNNKDEIGRLADAFNRMKLSLRQLIHEAGANTDQVAATSEELSASAEQTGKATEQIAAAIQEVAAGSSAQASSAAAAEQAAGDISTGMEQAAASIQRVAELAATANDKAGAGHEVVSKAIEQMSLVRQAVGETAEVVRALGEKSKEINQIVGWITEIASQTDLLALNATIEAARAGEHGRGFAVVASEVRKLAEQSGTAASQVRTVLEEMRTETGKAVRSMDAGTSVVQEGIDTVNRSGQSFSEIAGFVEQAAMESQEVASIIEQVNASAQGMLATMQNVARIAVQSAAHSQNVAAASEEQNAAMEEVSASAEALSMMAQELQQAISRFKA